MKYYNNEGYRDDTAGKAVNNVYKRDRDEEWCDICRNMGTCEEEQKFRYSNLNCCPWFA